MSRFWKPMPSPIGELKLVASETGLVALLWADEALLEPPPGELCPGHPVLAETQRQLGEYFARERRAFSLPLEFHGSAFQKQVWQELLAIPYGETRSYGEIARKIANPKAVRAVGAANGQNPIPIIAPCHRVVGSNGKLTGFAGGLETKAFLLRLEGSQRALFSPALKEGERV